MFGKLLFLALVLALAAGDVPCGIFFCTDCQSCVNSTCQGPAECCGDNIVNGDEQCDGAPNCGDDCNWDCELLCETEQDCACVGGCTLTQGYWRNHNLNRTAAQQKIPWPDVDGNGNPTGEEDATICDYINQYGSCAEGFCNINALDLLVTPPAGGNRWIQLSHQYIAAVNNVLKGEDQGGPACLTADLQQALEGAALALSQHCTEGGDIPVVKGQDEGREVIDCFQELLDSFNNGFIGPGHCGPEIECPDPETERCGCTLTQGYWGSSRFSDSHFEDIPANGSPRNHDTCHWPAELDHGVGDLQTDLHHDTVACTDPQMNFPNLTWFDALTTHPLPRDFNRQWHNTAKQYIAAHLNFQNGACLGDCANDQIQQDCDNIEALLDDSDIGNLFVNNDAECHANGGFKLLCDDITDSGARTACLALCESAELEDDDCKLYEVLAHFNEGDLGPGHCNDADGERNARGCCETCPYNEVREQHLGLAADVNVLERWEHTPCPPCDDCSPFEEALENKEPIELAVLIFLILAFIIALILLIYVCVRANNNSPTVNSKIPRVATLADHQSGKLN
jgi:hypothetical protein